MTKKRETNSNKKLARSASSTHCKGGNKTYHVILLRVDLPWTAPSKTTFGLLHVWVWTKTKCSTHLTEITVAPLNGKRTCTMERGGSEAFFWGGSLVACFHLTWASRPSCGCAKGRGMVFKGQADSSSRFLIVRKQTSTGNW